MGFPMRCDSVLIVRINILPGFNPLWVFQCAATRDWVISIPHAEVSIPYGFSNALRRVLFWPLHSLHFYVSIPYGFSNALRRGKSFRLPVKFDVSIPYGFSNALRPIINGRISNWYSVSIPYGFSNALRHRAYGREDLPECAFQSLMGFPMRCDLHLFFHPSTGSACFNPLWVFQCAATGASSHPLKNCIGFNPLWVFQCAATAWNKCSFCLIILCKSSELCGHFMNLLHTRCLYTFRKNDQKQWA